MSVIFRPYRKVYPDGTIAILFYQQSAKRTEHRAQFICGDGTIMRMITTIINYYIYNIYIIYIVKVTLKVFLSTHEKTVLCALCSCQYTHRF